jgi:cell division protein FtsA
MEEILEISAIEIKRSGYARHLAAGAVITGGGSLIPGTAALAADILGMETRVGRPTGLSGGLVEEVSDPKFATAVGLVLYGLRPEALGNALIGESEFAGDMGFVNEPTMPERNGRRPQRHTQHHHQHPSLANGESLYHRIANRMKAWFDEL